MCVAAFKTTRRFFLYGVVAQTWEKFLPNIHFNLYLILIQYVDINSYSKCQLHRISVSPEIVREIIQAIYTTNWSTQIAKCVRNNEDCSMFAAYIYKWS